MKIREKFPVYFGFTDVDNTLFVKPFKSELFGSSENDICNYIICKEMVNKLFSEELIQNIRENGGYLLVSSAKGKTIPHIKIQIEKGGYIKVFKNMDSEEYDIMVPFPNILEMTSKLLSMGFHKNLYVTLRANKVDKK